MQLNIIIVILIVVIKKPVKFSSVKKTTLRDWIKKHDTYKTLKRRNRKPVSYKITKKQVNNALNLVKKNQQITMGELSAEINHDDNSFEITPQHLGKVVRDNNRTRKRTKMKHFPKQRWKKPIEKKTELKKFYDVVNKYPLDKIISLDESSVENP